METEEYDEDLVGEGSDDDAPESIPLQSSKQMALSEKQKEREMITR